MKNLYLCGLWFLAKMYDRREISKLIDLDAATHFMVTTIALTHNDHGHMLQLFSPLQFERCFGDHL